VKTIAYKEAPFLLKFSIIENIIEYDERICKVYMKRSLRKNLPFVAIRNYYCDFFYDRKNNDIKKDRISVKYVKVRG
jgi:hypothetical protein